METYETTCKSCGKRIEVTVSNGELTKETMKFKCSECKLKERGEGVDKLLKVIFIQGIKKHG